MSMLLTEKEHPVVVIKLHAYDAELASKANVVFISHRDLRDVAASLCRKFQTGFSTRPIHETFDDYIKWKKIAGYDLRYEDLLTDRLSELKKIASTLKLPARLLEKIPYEEISREIEAERFTEQRSTAQRYDAVNLLHDGHITDGRHGSWKNFVPDEVVAAIENEFQGWMLAERYLTPVPAVMGGGNQE